MEPENGPNIVLINAIVNIESKIDRHVNQGIIKACIEASILSQVNHALRDVLQCTSVSIAPFCYNLLTFRISLHCSEV